MRKITIILSLLVSTALYSQNYQVGHQQISYIDSSRSNRSIMTEIYYPSATAGDNVAIANGQFPLLVFGHGYSMAWSAYQWLWDSIVPYGYIMVFPRTEGSMSPSHQDFGLDLRFLNEQLKKENVLSSSFFYQHLSNTSAIMGHSMGGGASFLAAENYTNFTTLINFAAATTTPSSITAATHVTTPLLMFSGENDGVAPPASHQIPMYDSCISACKTHITITGGGHCYFADYNFTCNLGEMATSPQPVITREAQHAEIAYLLIPYLNFMLKSSSVDESLFLNRLTNDLNITCVRNCNTTVLPSDMTFIHVYPNPVVDMINILIPNNHKETLISLIDVFGKILYEGNTTSDFFQLSLDRYSKNGIYFLQIIQDRNIRTFKIVTKSF